MRIREIKLQLRGLFLIQGVPPSLHELSLHHQCGKLLFLWDKNNINKHPSMFFQLIGTIAKRNCEQERCSGRWSHIPRATIFLLKNHKTLGLRQLFALLHLSLYVLIAHCPLEPIYKLLPASRLVYTTKYLLHGAWLQDVPL